MNDSSSLAGAEEKMRLTTVAQFRVPVGGQEIELQQLDYIHGGASQMRLRIREGKRFTIFDIDAGTAHHWGEEMVRWAKTHGAP